jgi:hypothetical protein
MLTVMQRTLLAAEPKMGDFWKHVDDKLAIYAKRYPTRQQMNEYVIHVVFLEHC